MKTLFRSAVVAVAVLSSSAFAEYNSDDLKAKSEAKLKEGGNAISDATDRTKDAAHDAKVKSEAKLKEGGNAVSDATDRTKDAAHNAKVKSETKLKEGIQVLSSFHA